MDNVLRDPIWQFIGAVLGFLAIVISAWIFFAQRQLKILAYNILSEESIVSARDEISGKLQILFQDTPVKNVFLVVIKLANPGNISITSKDYERDVRLIFDDRVRILTAEIAETQPENLGAEISVAENNIINLKPILLNGGDTITIKALISEYCEGLKVEGRIVGVKEIKKLTEGSDTIITFLLLIAAIVTAIAGGILEVSSGYYDLWKIHNPISQILLFVSYVLLFITVLKDRNFRKFVKRFRRKK